MLSHSRHSKTVEECHNSCISFVSSLAPVGRSKHTPQIFETTVFWYCQKSSGLWNHILPFMSCKTYDVNLTSALWFTYTMIAQHPQWTDTKWLHNYRHNIGFISLCAQLLAGYHVSPCTLQTTLELLQQPFFSHPCMLCCSMFGNLVNDALWQCPCVYRTNNYCAVR